MSEHKFRVGEELWLTWPENNGSVSILHVRVTDYRGEANPGYELRALGETMRFSAPYWVTDEQAAKWLTREPPTTQRVDSVSRAEPVSRFKVGDRVYAIGLREQFTGTVTIVLDENVRVDADPGESWVWRWFSLSDIEIVASAEPVPVNEFRGPLYEAAEQLAREQFGALAAKGLEEQRRAESAPVPSIPEIASMRVRPHESELVAEITIHKCGGTCPEAESERQRASRLGDRAGKAEKDLAEWQSMFGDIKRREADLESQLRSKDRQIAALKAKLLLLNRVCR